jgi:hypothetical protein
LSKPPGKLRQRYAASSKPWANACATLVLPGNIMRRARRPLEVENVSLGLQLFQAFSVVPSCVSVLRTAVLRQAPWKNPLQLTYGARNCIEIDCFQAAATKITLYRCTRQYAKQATQALQVSHAMHWHATTTSWTPGPLLDNSADEIRQSGCPKEKGHQAPVGKSTVTVVHSVGMTMM